MRIQNELASVICRLSAGIFSAALVLGMIAPGAASAKSATEVNLASASQALTYCQSGKMASKDIAYFSGTAGLAQFGPGSSCAQMVPTVKVAKAIQVVGSKVSECKMVNAKTSTLFCNDGAMGEWDIDYISGKPGEVQSGPGYGCGTNITTGGIGNAICK